LLGEAVILELEEFGLVAGQMGNVGEKARDRRGLRAIREIPRVNRYS